MNDFRGLVKKINYLVDHGSLELYPEIKSEITDLRLLLSLTNKNYKVKELKESVKIDGISDYVLKYGFDISSCALKIKEMYYKHFVVLTSDFDNDKAYLKEFLNDCLVDLYSVYLNLKQQNAILNFKDESFIAGLTFNFPLLDKYYILINTNEKKSNIQNTSTLVHELTHVYNAMYLKNDVEGLNKINYGLLSETTSLYTQMLYINYLKKYNKFGLILENNFYANMFIHFYHVANFVEALEHKFDNKYDGYLFNVLDKNGEVVERGNISSFNYVLGFLEAFKLFESKNPGINVINNFLNEVKSDSAYQNVLCDNYNYQFIEDCLKENIFKLNKYRK